MRFFSYLCFFVFSFLPVSLTLCALKQRKNEKMQNFHPQFFSFSLIWISIKMGVFEWPAVRKPYKGRSAENFRCVALSSLCSNFHPLSFFLSTMTSRVAEIWRVARGEEIDREDVSFGARVELVGFYWANKKGWVSSSFKSHEKILHLTVRVRVK